VHPQPAFTFFSIRGDLPVLIKVIPFVTVFPLTTVPRSTVVDSNEISGAEPGAGVSTGTAGTIAGAGVPTGVAGVADATGAGEEASTGGVPVSASDFPSNRRIRVSGRGEPVRTRSRIMIWGSVEALASLVFMARRSSPRRIVSCTQPE